MNIETIEHLHKRTEIVNGHWLWKGALVAGYGVTKYNGKNCLVGRLSLAIYLKLNMRDTWQACHIDSLCKEKNCWNPLHLYKGTIQDNRQDSINSGTKFTANRKAFCKQGHALTEDNIYSRTRDGVVHRDCKKCRYLATKRYQNKEKVL